jgi:hypothetical protein
MKVVERLLGIWDGPKQRVEYTNNNQLDGNIDDKFICHTESDFIVLYSTAVPNLSQFM